MTSATPGLSVVIATRNRAAALSRCFEALARCSATTHPFEVIVADNGSTDDTPLVVKDASRAYTMDLRRIEVPVAGLSAARNAGVREANGKAILFIDDDALATAEWLRVCEFELLDRRSDVVQPRVLPHFAVPPPSWALAEGIGLYGGVDQGKSSGPLNGNLHGVSFGFQRTVFDHVGPFREDLGAGRIGLGEDTEFGLRARTAGFEIIYVPDAVVYHFIQRGRLNRSWYLRRQYSSGLCQPLFQNYPEPLWRALSAFARDSACRLIGGLFARNASDQMAVWGQTAGHFGRMMQLSLGRKHA